MGANRVKRWIDSFVALLYALRDETLEALHEEMRRDEMLQEMKWRQRTAERQAITRNLVRYWLFAPVMLWIVIGLVDWLSRN